MFDPADWYCCLSVWERNFLSALVFRFITPPGWMVLTEYLGYWALSGHPSHTARFYQFADTYHLTPAVVEVEPDVFIEVMQFDSDVWSVIYAFYLLGDITCPDPCSFKTFPFNLPG